MAELIADFVTLSLVIVPMIVASAMIAALAFLAGAKFWHWYHWLILAPVLYVCWLLIVLLLWAWSCRQLGRRHPKPRHVVFRAGQRGSLADRGLITALVCYRRFAILKSLPLAPAIDLSNRLQKLFLRAYSPSVHIGKGTRIWGYLYDPDLTTIGEGVLIGGRVSIAAHTQSARKSGEMVYLSAPVSIGDRATIGGESRVSLGCVIGEDAVLEPGSFLGPFVNVPANEVWGGNPARFLRSRDDAAPAAAPEAAEQAPVNDEIRRLVMDALNLSQQEVESGLTQANCWNWDSLGQIAIAAAIFSRYGVPVDAAEMFRIRTLADVALVASGKKLSPAAAPQLDAPLKMDPPLKTATVTLPDDFEMLPLLEPQEATRALAARFQGAAPAGAQPIRVVIASSFVMNAVAAPLKLWGRAFGFEIEPVFAEYNQIVQTLLDRQGLFYSNPDGVNLVLTRLEDIAGSSQASSDLMDSLLEAVENFASQPAGHLLVGNLPPVVSAFSSVAEKGARAMRERWQTALEALPDVEVLDFGGVVEQLGIEKARSNQSEILTRGPYSPRVYQQLAIALVRRIRAVRRSPAKVLALDCDNTLWGGVVGEVGMEGIELGSDGPGRSFQLFQRHVKSLKDRGILLVVASKNEERDVREVFERHPEMILRPEDIAAWRVNWQPKHENLRSLAAELNLGIDSFVFLDDDPFIRTEVQSATPQVHVVPLPADPSDYCEALSRLWLFDVANATQEDAARTRMIQEESVRQSELGSAASLDGFLAGLLLRVDVSHASDQEWPRVAQLTQRTNQFNLSLKRRTVGEIRALASEASVLTLRASDRFGEYGLVGVCALRPKPGLLEIDTLLMSCRVLGRGVEDAFLHAMGEVGRLQGAKKLVAPYLAGPRNAQIRDFLLRVGFNEASPDLWELAISDLPALPAHIEFRGPEVSVRAAQTSAV
jgi:FkbH-like protein